MLSIPPYLSTSWKNISSLQTIEEDGFFRLIVLLQNKTKVEIPRLNKEMVERIFDAHSRYSESEIAAKSPHHPMNGPFSFSLPIPSDGAIIDSLGSSMQHNEEQANLPPLAPDILKKIGTVARAFGLEDLSLLPNPKTDCNCIYCQVVRAMKNESADIEEISEEDLKFQNWKIEQTAEKLYLVTNPLDPSEHYNVYLGEPLGCTCGKKNCEHIKEVLTT